MSKQYLTGYIKHIYDHEFERIRRYTKTKIQSPSMRMCIGLMIFLGLGRSDVNNLKRQNFNDDFSVLNFTRKKTGKPVERKLQDWLSKELKKYYKKFNHRFIDDHLFFASYKSISKNQYIQANSITQRFARIREHLQIKEVYYTTKTGTPLHRLTSHTMRHYAIYRFYLAAGKDVKAAQQIIGHTKIETTSKITPIIVMIIPAAKEKPSIPSIF